MKQKDVLKIIIFILLAVLLVFVFVVFIGKNFPKIQTSLVKYYYGASYQCVAYVERYYQNMFNIKISNVGWAMRLADRASRYGLFFHPNGGDIPPQVGDILVFGNKNKIGHVAIVTGVLKEGVLIVEQNWLKGKITYNNGKPLPGKYLNGRYLMADRYYGKDNRYWVIGWVSRLSGRPGNFFDLRAIDNGGWLMENDLVRARKQLDSSWTLKVVGRDPRILSPVFFDPLFVKDYDAISFRVNVRHNEIAEEGVVYLRDQNDQWSVQIPFSVDYSEEEFQTIRVDLSVVPRDFEITQIMLRLTDKRKRYPREIWQLDWIRLVPSRIDIL